MKSLLIFFLQAEDGIRDLYVTGVQTCALPISDLPAAPDPPVGLEVAYHPVPGPPRGTRAQRDGKAPRRRAAGDPAGDRAHRLGGEARRAGPRPAAGPEWPDRHQSGFPARIP